MRQTIKLSPPSRSDCFLIHKSSARVEYSITGSFEGTASRVGERRKRNPNPRSGGKRERGQGKDPDIEKQTTRLYRSKTGTDNKPQALAFKPKKEAIILLEQKDIALQNRY